jgi:hypothetical protein
VSSNPAALALLTNPNAPNTGGSFVTFTNTNPPNNPANNSAQNCGSCN